MKHLFRKANETTYFQSVNYFLDAYLQNSLDKSDVRTFCYDRNITFAAQLCGMTNKDFKASNNLSPLTVARLERAIVSYTKKLKLLHPEGLSSRRNELGLKPVYGRPNRFSYPKNQILAQDKLANVLMKNALILSKA